MIYGVGTDIVSVSRIQRIMEKHSNFLSRFFTPNEREYFSKKKYSDETIAACFAAKEAVSKALKTGFREFSFCDIEVCHAESGAPFIELYNKARELFDELGLSRIHLSLSHEREHAVAYCVIEL